MDIDCVRQPELLIVGNDLATLAAEFTTETWRKTNIGVPPDTKKCVKTCQNRGRGVFIHSNVPRPGFYAQIRKFFELEAATGFLGGSGPGILAVVSCCW